MSPSRNILVVDDEKDLAELVRHHLAKENYGVETVGDGEAALEALRKNAFDLIVLDLMLPGVQGLEVCRMLKNDPKHARVPIIMLTARNEEMDRVLGLELGADDYVTKPFSPRELVARVKAVLRRAGSGAPTGGALHAGDLEIDPETYSVTRDGEKLELSATEFRLLYYLAGRKGKVFSRDQLLDAVWRDEAFVEPRTVDVHIRRLRSRVERDPARPELIRTRRGIGYYMDQKS